MTQQTKHTSGPWKAVYCTLPFTGYEILMTEDKGKPGYRQGIARVPAVNEIDTANARLIAAAPELLEACKLVVQDLENNGEILSTDEKRISVLTDAITKATQQ